MENLRRWARLIKRDVVALYFAGRDARVPWYSKAVAVAVAAYALSPIDLIPDFIPILGQVDDLLIVPAGIFLAVKLIPPEIMSEHRAAAFQAEQQPSSRAVAAVIIAIWIAAGALLLWAFWPTPTR